MAPPDKYFQSLADEDSGKDVGNRNYQHDAHIARAAVKEVFAILGVDVDDPEKVEEFRKDLRFGGDMRRMRDRGMLTMIGIIFTAIGVAIVGTFFKNGGHG
jgi:hypothetical protein